MLYPILKLVVRLALRVFYRNISASGKQHVPAKGPLIVVANHPNTLMDPLLVAAQLNREIYFLAKSSFFNTAFKNWLLRKLHMIPVYRAQDLEKEGRTEQEMAAANQAVFAQCIQHLRDGGTLMIFPEGTSILERRLRELKTGTARIALSALADGLPEVPVLPVGLNYSHATRFRSEVVIKIGEPVQASDYLQAYHKNSWEAVKSLTAALSQNLQRLIVSTENEEEDDLLQLIELVYKPALVQELGIAPKNRQAGLELSQELSQGIAWYKRYQPVLVRNLHVRLSSFVAALRRLGLHQSYLRKPAKNTPTPLDFVPGLGFLILGFPVYVYGLLHNYLPYRLPGIAAEKLTEEQEFEAPIMLGTGLFTFPVWYALCIWVGAQFLSWPWLVLYGLSLPVSGFFALFYAKSFLSERGRWQLRALTNSRANLIARLRTEQEQILAELRQLKELYLKREG